MTPRLINRIELSFWDYAIPRMSNSSILRRAAHNIQRMGIKKSLVIILSTIAAGSILGLLTGVALRSIFM